MSLTILLLFCAIIGVYSIPNLNVCKKEDSVCYRRNSNIIYKISIAGDSKFGIGPLDPIFHSKIEGNLGIIKYELKNSTITGFTDCNVVHVKMDLDNSKIGFDIVCPYVEMDGLYQVTGRLLSVPVEGKGDYNLKFKDYHIHLDNDIKITEDTNGVKFLSFKSFKADGDLKGWMKADIKNLFNGQQEELAKAALQFINENGKDVSKLLQGPVFNANIKKLIKNFNKILKSVTFDDLFSQ